MAGTPHVVERGDASSAEHKEGVSDRLVALLNDYLDFHDEVSDYSSHNFHSFPAKFPPQLPRKFITALTGPGEIVLDPMMGSGTTVLEAFLAGGCAVGIDIDPLAVLSATRQELRRKLCGNVEPMEDGQ